MKSVKIVSVDLQKDFSAEKGLCYIPRPCTEFIKSVLIPYVRRYDIKIAEIISDYRLPRPGDEFECCVPGTDGYKSEIPNDVKDPNVWIKSMNSPIWIRENRGVPGKPAGIPYPDPVAFSDWTKVVLGTPVDNNAIVLIGLTLDCCILCTAQELKFRGYQIRFLVEGLDTYSGSQEEKQEILKIPLSNWGEPISWNQIRKMQ
jgi:hypothetical protein